MTQTDPFTSWSNDYKQEQARLTATHVRHLRQHEHQAGRHLKEALAYYQSQQWTTDGVEAEALDALINRLRQDTETAASLRQQAETNLGKLLHSQRPYEDPTALARRHEDMVYAAKPTGNQQDAVEPTPLETFLASRARKHNQPDPAPRKPKKRARAF